MQESLFNSEPTVVLVDAKNFCYRAHFTHMTLSSQGRPTGVLYGGLDMMLTLAKRVGPEAAICFVWDGGGETWRHRLSRGVYKANRVYNDTAKVASDQFEQFRAFLESIGIRNFIVPGLEGDDLVGILATSATGCGCRVLICSTDQDYNQLVTAPNGRDGVGPCHILAKFRTLKETEYLTPKKVWEKYGVQPKDWTKYRALTGDKGDNIIKAKKGIGPKTALSLLELGINPSNPRFDKQPYMVQMACSHLKSVWGQVYMNYQLSTIVTSAEDALLDGDVKGCLAIIPAVTAPAMKFFTRESEKRDSEEAYNAALTYLADYEMEEILGRRRELFAIP